MTSREEFILLIEESGLEPSDADIDYHTDEFKNKNVDAIWVWHKNQIEAATAHHKNEISDLKLELLSKG